MLQFELTLSIVRPDVSSSGAEPKVAGAKRLYMTPPAFRHPMPSLRVGRKLNLSLILSHFFMSQYLIKHYENVSTCVDKKNQLDVTFCILYFSSNSCSTCFGQTCDHHQELTTAWCYNLVLVCAVAAGRLSRPVGSRSHFLYSLILF